MGVLTEYVRKEAEQLQGELGRREESRKEWLEAFARLTDRMKEWVTAADGGLGLLEATGGQTYTRQEAALGVYTLTSLLITLGGQHSGRAAEVVPRARYTSATIKPPGKEARKADGMAEIRDGSSAEYYLFRLKEEGGDRWYIQSVTQWNADPEYGKVEELDRDRFEAAILRILK
jgi:hypothetical protein